MARDLLLITIGPPPPGLVEQVFMKLARHPEVELLIQQNLIGPDGDVALSAFRQGAVDWDKIDRLFKEAR